MGRGDNRNTPKSRRRARQRKLKARRKKRLSPKPVVQKSKG